MPKRIRSYFQHPQFRYAAWSQITQTESVGSADTLPRGETLGAARAPDTAFYQPVEKVAAQLERSGSMLTATAAV